MRFRRREWLPPFEDTLRKRAAARRAQQREREALPLFADMIAAEQPAIDEVMDQRAVAWAEWEQRERDHRAAMWRRARAALAGLGHNMRPIALAYWNGHRWLPGDPVYLLDMVHSIERGKLVPDDRAGFRFASSPTHAEDAAIIEAFRTRAARAVPLPLSG